MNFRTFLVLVGLAVATGFLWYSRKGCTSCGCPHSAAPVAAEAKSFHIVNVLDQNLFADAHISGSENVPFEELMNVAQAWDKNATIVLYCSNYICSASGKGAEMLRARGFKNAFAYEGGMAEWFALANDPEVHGWPKPSDTQARCAFTYEGPAQESYLKDVLSAPETHKEYVISAYDLRALMVEHGILKVSETATQS